MQRPSAIPPRLGALLCSTAMWTAGDGSTPPPTPRPRGQNGHLQAQRRLSGREGCPKTPSTRARDRRELPRAPVLQYHRTPKQTQYGSAPHLNLPPGAKPGQQLLSRTTTASASRRKCPRAWPGMKFLAHRKALGRATPARRRPLRKVAAQSKLRARQPTPMPSAAPSQRSSRQPSGYGSRQPTARGVGSQDPNRAKWDIDTHRTTYRAPSTQRSFPPDTPLGDQEWFEQFGFSGAVSEEKARDYGNGVPMWSPYFRNPKDYVKQPLSGLAPDAYWFEQYGSGREAVRTRFGSGVMGCRRGRPTTGRGAEKRRRAGRRAL